MEAAQRVEEQACCLDISNQFLLHPRTWQGPALTQVNPKDSKPGARILTWMAPTSEFRERDLKLFLSQDPILHQVPRYGWQQRLAEAWKMLF